MTAPNDLDRQLEAFLAYGPTELPDPSFDVVRERMETIDQRVVIGPWRTPIMNKLVSIGLGAAAVVAIAIIGAQLLGPPAPDGPGVAPSPSPSTVASPTAEPTPVSPPPLTESFTSERHGVSISYPSGWVTRPAAESWTTGLPDCLQTTADIIHDGDPSECNLWIAVASQPIEGSTPDEWMADILAVEDGCGTTEPFVIDGARGLIGTFDCTRAAVTTDGRGYFFWLYTGDTEPGEMPLGLTYDRAWFEEFLATVQLQPEDAVDVAASASP